MTNKPTERKQMTNKPTERKQMTNKPTAADKQSQDASIKEVIHMIYGKDSLTVGMLDEICHMVNNLESRMYDVHAKNEDAINPAQFSVCVAISTAMVLAHVDQTYKKDQGKGSGIISVIQHGHETMMAIAREAMEDESASSTKH